MERSSLLARATIHSSGDTSKTRTDTPSIGACHPDFRKKLKRGDHIFVVSGRVPDANQFVMGGFEVYEKMNAVDAYAAYPEQRLRALENGELAGTSL